MSSELLDDVLGNLVARGEIVPAGAEAIKKHPSLQNLSREAAVGKVFELLTDPTREGQPDPYTGLSPAPTLGQRCKNPLFKPDKGKTTLERTLEAFPLKEGSAATLASEWQFDLGHMRPGEMARAITRRLSDRSNHQHLKNTPARPASEARLLDAFHDNFNAEVPLEVRDRLAQSWSFEYTHLRGPALTAAIANRLAHAAEHYGCRPIERNDPRLGGRSPRRDTETASSPLHRSNPF